MSSNPSRPTVECNPGQVVDTRASVTNQYNLVTSQQAVMSCGWKGKRHTSQTLVVVHPRAQGLEEGDEHPRALLWSTIFYCAIEIVLITLHYITVDFNLTFTLK